jgi:hypothetical protein
VLTTAQRSEREHDAAGSGGSVGFAEPDAGVGFAYIPNLWSWNIAELRAKNLAAGVVACLE